MARIAVIKDNKVENIASWDGDEDWKISVEAAGYKLIDVSNKPEVDIDWLCSESNELSSPNVSQE